MRIFLAGASGIIGRRLIPLLCSAGHQVTGTARSVEKAAVVRSLGATPVIVDALEPSSLDALVVAARPECVIHQLTSLPDEIGSGLSAAMAADNARIRRDGTRNLVAAALHAGARRFVAQSVAWLYADGPLPHGEGDPLDLASEGTRALTARGVSELERLVMSTPSLEGVVLRFGYLYGPETWFTQPKGEVSLHIDAAVAASAQAVTRGAVGAYNIVDDGGTATNAKARAELGWEPTLRGEGASYGTTIRATPPENIDA